VSSDGATQQGGIRSVLREAPEFRWLWLSQMSSAIGDGILTVGITAYILGDEGISTLGLVLGSNALGFILLSLPAGLLSDRYQRQRLLIVALVLRCVSVLLLALTATVDDAVPYWLVLTFVEGAGRALNWPAYQALVADLLPSDLRRAGNSLGAASLQATGVVGPTLGGVLVTLAGARPTLVADGVLFAVASVPLLLLPARDGHGGGQSSAEDVAEVITVVRRRRWLSASIFSNGLQLTLVIPAVYLIVPLVAARSGPSTYGLLLATQSAGAVVATVIASRWEPRRRGLASYCALSALALPLLSGAVTDAVFPLYVSLFLCGIGVTLYTTYWFTAIQDGVPPRVLGRVIGLTSVTSLTPVGYALIGILLDRTEIWVVSILAGVGLAISIAVPLSVRGGMEMRRKVTARRSARTGGSTAA
jgi:MFS family permease